MNDSAQNHATAAPDEAAVVLRARGLCKAYGVGEVTVQALRDAPTRPG